MANIMDDVEIKKEEKIELKEPEMSKVYILNDDYSTFEFVTRVLTNVFGKATEEAKQITVEVHKDGKGLVGIYSQDIALTKISQVSKMARSENCPLKAIIQ